jgi:hypothetical protein
LFVLKVLLLCPANTPDLTVRAVLYRAESPDMTLGPRAWGPVRNERYRRPVELFKVAYTPEAWVASSGHFVLSIVSRASST